MIKNIQSLKYLKYTSLSKTLFWDFYSLNNETYIDSNYPIVKLGSVLKQRKESIIIEDDKKYKRCRVQVQAKGVVLRDEVFGKEIKTKKQQLCRAKDFLVAEIDAKVGGYGIVPSNLENAIVSSHYFLFEIDTNKLMPEFLSLILKQYNFSKQVKSTGSTNYAAIRPYHVLGYEIPLPSILEQKKIILKYNKKLKLAEKQDEEANFLEIDIEKYLFEELGIENEEKIVEKKGIKLYSFSSIDRWDVWVNKNIDQSYKFKSTTFGEVVIGKPFYGANVKGLKKKSDTRYIRITDINETGDLNDEFVSPEHVEEKYLLKENDFLIARSGNTVGKTFLFKEIYGRCIFAGYLVKYNIDSNKILPEYLLLFTKTHLFKKWIESNKRISGQPNINGQEFLDSPLLLPSLEIQRNIVNVVNSKKFKIKELNRLSAYNRKSALKVFENEIFKE